MINLNSWDSETLVIRRPELSPSFVITEFFKKRSKVVSHRLARVNFEATKSVNDNRNSTIDSELFSTKASGEFKFGSISHVYQPTTLVEQVNGAYEVTCHGAPLGGDRATFESCLDLGFKCKQGEGTDSLCNVGKCVFGKIAKDTNLTWKFTSQNVYAPGGNSLEYSFFEEKSLRLKSISRGVHKGLLIDKPASVSVEVHLPPALYFDFDFTNSHVLNLDKSAKIFLREHYLENPTDSSQIAGIKRSAHETLGLDDLAQKFISTIITLAFKSSSEGFLNSQLYLPVGEEVDVALEEFFKELNSIWLAELQNVFSSRKATSTTTFEFLLLVYRDVKQLFSKIVIGAMSSVEPSAVALKADSASRPIYSRLPGIAEAYRKDPSFRDGDDVANWLTSGTDEFLSDKKTSIALFYYNYLNPDTCNPLNLDWLGQHVGLFGPLWDVTWPTYIKRTLIKNSFGWWDRDLTEDIPGADSSLTVKGEVLSEQPFTRPEWTDTSDEDNFSEVKTDEVETLELNLSNELVGYTLYSIPEYDSDSNTVTLTRANEIKINKARWNGLMESKGSFLCSAFLCSVFGLKAHVPWELSIVDAPRGLFKPRDGLRSAEFEAPVLIPHKGDFIQVGSEQDYEAGNYRNQLVAGVSRVHSIRDSKNVFYRVPFYYNRNGQSWKKVEYIAKNWLPANVNARVQYPYLAAGLWKVGDAFFRPNIRASDPGTTFADGVFESGVFS